MKKLILILSLLLSSHCFAQPGGGWPIIFNEDYQELDTLRKSFLALFDPSQFYITDNDRIIIATLKDSVYPIGMINTPNFTDSMYRNHPALKKHWTEYVIHIRLLTKMKDDDKKRLKNFNDSILQLMKDLPKKHNIQHLRNEMDMYYGKNKKDRKNVELFEKEIQFLFDQLFPLPQFSTQYLDVYVLDDKVFEGYDQHPEWNAYLLCPDSANSLRWKIWDGIKEIQKRFEK